MVHGGHHRLGGRARNRRYPWAASVDGEGVYRIEPSEYFALFRNSELDEHGDFAWFGQHVVTMFDDHDQIHKGNEKRPFCGMVEYRKLVFNALAVNLTTAGIPCIYDGTEQGFDSGSQSSPSDKVLRENMFGGHFGAKCTRGVHFFDEDTPLFKLYRSCVSCGMNGLRCGVAVSSVRT